MLTCARLGVQRNVVPSKVAPAGRLSELIVKTVSSTSVALTVKVSYDCLWSWDMNNWIAVPDDDHFAVSAADSDADIIDDGNRKVLSDEAFIRG